MQRHLFSTGVTVIQPDQPIANHSHPIIQSIPHGQNQARPTFVLV